jgi:DNA-directed RNA polymerase specialized sigma24 family protein
MRYNHELNGNLRAACNKPATVAENNRLYPLVVAGDDEAHEQMIVNNMPLALVLVESFLAARPQYAHLQDDISAEAFLRVVEVVNLFATGRKVNSPTSYLSRSIRRHIRASVQQAAFVRSPLGEQPPHVSTQHDTSKIMLGVRTRTVGNIDLSDLIDACCESSLDRELVSLREEGHTFAEIATRTRIPKRTVIRMFHAIRDRFDAKTKALHQ